VLAGGRDKLPSPVGLLCDRSRPGNFAGLACPAARCAESGAALQHTACHIALSCFAMCISPWRVPRAVVQHLVFVKCRLEDMIMM
jgi:hypothetical protein